MSLDDIGRSKIFPQKDDCLYTKCYCEENVWNLCEYVKREHKDELNNCHAVFISNLNKAIPIWQQSASKTVDQPVIWDYHVILVYRDHSNNCAVYDLDTRLPFPCPFDDYTAKAIQPDQLLQEGFHRMFRVIPAAVFLETFASDRSHMMKPDKSWMAPPPSYPCIRTTAILDPIPLVLLHIVMMQENPWDEGCRLAFTSTFDGYKTPENVVRQQRIHIQATTFYNLTGFGICKIFHYFPKSQNNIEEFISMDPKVGAGEVCCTRTFADYFGCSHAMITKYLDFKKTSSSDIAQEHQINKPDTIHPKGITNIEYG